MPDYGVITLLFRVHYHNWHGNSCFTEFNTFISISNCQVIYSVKLKDVCYLKTSASIAESFYHYHNFCFRFQQVLENLQIMNKCVEINFQKCFVRLLLKQLAYFFEFIFSCAFQQNRFIAEILQRKFFKKIFCGFKKFTL